MAVAAAVAAPGCSWWGSQRREVYRVTQRWPIQLWLRPSDPPHSLDVPTQGPYSGLTLPGDHTSCCEGTGDHNDRRSVPERWPGIPAGFPAHSATAPWRRPAMAGANPDCQTGSGTGPEGAWRQTGHFRHRPLADLTDPTVSLPVRSPLYEASHAARYERQALIPRALRSLSLATPRIMAPSSLQRMQQGSDCRSNRPTPRAIAGRRCGACG